MTTNLISLISLVVNAISLFIFFTVGEHILFVNRNDPNYNRGKTVRIFNIYFLICGAFNIALLVYFSNHVITPSVLFFLTASAIVSLICVYHYIKQIVIFTRRDIPAKEVVKFVKEIVDGKFSEEEVLEPFMKMDMDEEIKKELKNSLKNINDAHSDNRND